MKYFIALFQETDTDVRYPDITNESIDRTIVENSCSCNCCNQTGRLITAMEGIISDVESKNTERAFGFADKIFFQGSYVF